MGRLINGRWADMFWDEYDIDASAEFAAIVYDPTNWLSFHFRDPATGETVTDAAPSADYAETLPDSQIGMQGLYTESDLRPPSRLSLLMRNIDGAVYAVFYFAALTALSYVVHAWLGR